jgi:hypothetical protein
LPGFLSFLHTYGSLIFDLIICMKYIFTLLMLLIGGNLFAQKKDDSKIVLTLSDSSGIYKKVKYALVNNDFVVKDNGNEDTLTTYSREFSGIHCIGKAVITNNTVILTGVYGLKKIDDFGYTQAPQRYQRITYFRGSKGWKLLMQVASRISDQISYDK